MLSRKKLTSRAARSSAALQTPPLAAPASITPAATPLAPNAPGPEQGTSSESGPSRPDTARSTPLETHDTPPAPEPEEPALRIELSSEEERLILARRRAYQEAGIPLSSAWHETLDLGKGILEKKWMQAVTEGAVDCAQVRCGFEELGHRVACVSKLAAAVSEAYLQVPTDRSGEGLAMCLQGIGLALRALAREAGRPDLWVYELQKRVEAEVGKKDVDHLGIVLGSHYEYPFK